MYAKCTFCDKPRDERVYNALTPKKDLPKRIGYCDECGLPTNNKKWNLCHNHYVAKWKKETNYNSDYMRKWRAKRKSLQSKGVV